MLAQVPDAEAAYSTVKGAMALQIFNVLFVDVTRRYQHHAMTTI